MAILGFIVLVAFSAYVSFMAVFCLLADGFIGGNKKDTLGIIIVAICLWVACYFGAPFELVMK